MNRDWQEKVLEYCEKYDIPLMYLAETLYEPKVVPMIRGKSFEFAVMMALQRVLPGDEWEVRKRVMNAQTGFHDVDVDVINKSSKKAVRVECKLAKKQGYRLFPDRHSEIRVKCMRSRTLGLAKIRELAPKLGVERAVLAIHNDQYLPADFDMVISSIGNAFYITDKDTGLFEWRPTETEKEFLRKLNPPNRENLKKFAFHRMYAARAQDLAVRHGSGVTCTRERCKNINDCGFIPNYPRIYFDSDTNLPTNGWVPIEECLKLFRLCVND